MTRSLDAPEFAHALRGYARAQVHDYVRRLQGFLLDAEARAREAEERARRAELTAGPPRRAAVPRTGQDARMIPDPAAFARQWAQEWNSRDLDRILAHYAPDVVFRSPVAARLVPESHGVVQGRDALRQYWARALAQAPDLHFEVLDVYAGVSTLLIRFRNQLGAVRCEVLTFRDGLVVEGEGTDLVAPG